MPSHDHQRSLFQQPLLSSPTGNSTTSSFILPFLSLYPVYQEILFALSSNYPQSDHFSPPALRPLRFQHLISHLDYCYNYLNDPSVSTLAYSLFPTWKCELSKSLNYITSDQTIAVTSCFNQRERKKKAMPL